MFRSRLKYTNRLMRFIRFPFIAVNDLTEKVLECPYVANIAEVRENVCEAIRYQRFPNKRINLPEPRTTFKVR